MNGINLLHLEKKKCDFIFKITPNLSFCQGKVPIGFCTQSRIIRQFSLQQQSLLSIIGHSRCIFHTIWEEQFLRQLSTLSLPQFPLSNTFNLRLQLLNAFVNKTSFSSMEITILSKIWPSAPLNIPELLSAYH